MASAPSNIAQASSLVTKANVQTVLIVAVSVLLVVCVFLLYSNYQYSVVREDLDLANGSFKLTSPSGSATYVVTSCNSNKACFVYTSLTEPSTGGTPVSYDMETAGEYSCSNGTCTINYKGTWIATVTQDQIQVSGSWVMLQGIGHTVTASRITT